LVCTIMRGILHLNLTSFPPTLTPRAAVSFLGIASKCTIGGAVLLPLRMFEVSVLKSFDTGRVSIDRGSGAWFRCGTATDCETLASCAKLLRVSPSASHCGSSMLLAVIFNAFSLQRRASPALLYFPFTFF